MIKFLKRLFAKQHPKVHPGLELKPSISPAFKIGDEQYYEFDSLLDVPPLRYKKMDQFFTEVNMRMDRDTLISLIDKAIEHCDSDNIKISKVVSILMDIKDRTEMIIETETLYRLATCVYYTMDENLYDYDFDYNEKKLKLFKGQPIKDFFFTKLMKNLVPQINISQEDTQIFLKITEAQKRFEKDILLADSYSKRR